MSSEDLKNEAEDLGIKIDGRWGDDRLAEEIAKAKNEVNVSPESAESEPSVEDGGDDIVDEMNELALRIWTGQSVSVPLGDRVRRIISRLRDKGYLDVSGLKLPAKGYERYL